MKHQTIWKTSILTTAETEDAVAELLATHVAPSPSSYADFETGHLTVSTYSATPPKNVAITKRILRSGLKEIETGGLNVGLARITIRKLPRRNWAESWKRHFKPIEIGGRLLVKPSWVRRQPRRGQAVIVLDPGLSFGTGQHPTTEYCLRELVRGTDMARRWPRPLPAGGVNRVSTPESRRPIPRRHRGGSPQPGNPHRSFLDIGTGSGILAIAAAKLGCTPVHAFDYDVQSVLVAKANAAANHVANQIKLTRADLTKLPRSARKYDLVCANLLAHLLIAERDRILARVKPDGMLVVAGILKREFHELQTAYDAAGWVLVASKAQKEWRAGTLVRRR